MNVVSKQHIGNHGIFLIGKVKKWTDESNARSGFLELCPDWKDYPEGYAIGMGKTYDVPDTRPVKLMGTKLFKYINCEKVYKQIGIPVDEQAQVWSPFLLHLQTN